MAQGPFIGRVKPDGERYDGKHKGEEKCIFLGHAASDVVNTVRGCAIDDKPYEGWRLTEVQIGAEFRGKAHIYVAGIKL